MRDYSALKKICDQHFLDADDVRDIIDVYADCLEAAEPAAVNSIQEARNTAFGLSCELAEFEQ